MQMDYEETVLPRLKIYKNKTREGVVERVMDEYTVIAKSIFKKETNIQLFSNLKVTLSTGETGFIEGSFGQSGKVKLRFPDGLTQELLNSIELKKAKSKSKEGADTKIKSVLVQLKFKRYIYDKKKKMIQN
ncbi:Selenocysteine-specific elongation factor [Trichoplax sp. H2]|nr:Selenocysteine-specific elongation factor [Trichoplax sp. H2]|eukprot:RDD39171.1 Selenocysteine-specific elongation factor [Trichoplax sp. H2]